MVLFWELKFKLYRYSIIFMILELPINERKSIDLLLDLSKQDFNSCNHL